MPCLARCVLALLLATAALAVPATATAGDEDPLNFIAFSTDFDSKCVERRGVMIYIANTHPSRTMKLVLERWYMDNRTADRGRSLLKPGVEPEPLGCSNIEGGKQEWKVLKSEWAD
ncbi:MAG: hypothetical protein FGM40_00130 [Rhodocyclaceae bacterium]|nr:hypothetical protein [Rhodocyclaceae bacterium]